MLVFKRIVEVNNRIIYQYNMKTIVLKKYWRVFFFLLLFQKTYHLQSNLVDLIFFLHFETQLIKILCFQFDARFIFDFLITTHSSIKKDDH